jgi:hypothetical protein
MKFIFLRPASFVPQTGTKMSKPEGVSRKGAKLAKKGQIYNQDVNIFLA